MSKNSDYSWIADLFSIVADAAEISASVTQATKNQQEAKKLD